MRLTDKELRRHVAEWESAYKNALLTQERWGEEQSDCAELPDWIAKLVGSAHDNWTVAYELLVLRGLCEAREDKP